jgi:excisionase family DNA binding protein
MSPQPRETRLPEPAGRLRLTATDVMTVSEVSALLHVPVSTIADWGRRGLLPSVKIGRRRLYLRPHIEDRLWGESSARAHQ